MTCGQSDFRRLTGDPSRSANEAKTPKIKRAVAWEVIRATSEFSVTKVCNSEVRAAPMAASANSVLDQLPLQRTIVANVRT